MTVRIHAILLSISALSLTVAAIADVETGWLAVAASAGAILIASSLITGRSVSWLLSLHAVACVLLGWSLAERVSVTSSAQADRLQARAGGDLVQARDARYPAGGVAIWMDGAASSRPARAVPERLAGVAWLHALARPAYDGYRGGLSGITLELDGETRSGFEVFWQEDAARQDLLASEASRSITVRLDALRPTEPFAVFTRYNDDEGYRTLARPESRDLSLSRVRDGRLVQELENRGSPFRKDVFAAAQSVLRELGRTWLFALLLAAVGMVISTARQIATIRSGGHPARRRSANGETASAARAGRMPAATVWAICVGAISLLAIAATAWIALGVFEGVPHDRDSVAYLFQARLFAAGAVTAPTPAMPEFFKEDFIVQHQGKWFGKYPPGHPLVLALGVMAGAPWLVGPLLAGAAVALLGALGAQLFGRGVGLAAAGLLVTSPFFLFMSGSYLAHPTSLALTLGALWLSQRLLWSTASGARQAAVLGLVLGALFCTRQLTAAALGMCLGAWILCDSSRGVRQRLVTLILIAAGALPLALGLLGFQYATTGNPLLSPQLLWWSYDTIGFGPGVGADGWHDPAMGLHDTWDRLTELQRHLFGWPFYITLAPAMLPFLAGRASRRDWWLLSVVVALVLAYVLYWNRGMAYGPRYYYEALGPLCLLSVRGFQALARIGVGGRLAAGSTYGGAVALALIAFNVSMYLPQQVDEYSGYLGVDGRRARLMQDAALQRGLVFVRDEPRGGWQAYASVFWLNSPTLDGPIVYARDRGEENARLRELMPDRPAFVLSQSSLTPLADP